LSKALLKHRNKQALRNLHNHQKHKSRIIQNLSDDWARIKVFSDVNNFFVTIMDVRINLYVSRLIFRDFKVNDQVSL
jgi:hypothetical protein